MSVSAAAAIDKPPRRAVPLKQERKPRHPGAEQVWRRLREADEEWDMLIKYSANESLGSHISLLRAQNEITAFHADAARYFAKFCARADHYAGTPKRSAASPAYELGFFKSRNDEEALARLQGTIKDYERRANGIRKRWDRIHSYIGDEKVFSLLLDVCVQDVRCPTLQIPVLRRALEILVHKLGLNRIRPEDKPRMQPKRRYRKPKGDQNDRHRDPSSYYNRDSAPAAAVPVPQGGGSSQD